MNGRALHADRAGRGAPLMLLHGYTGSGRSLAGVAQGLRHEFATIAPDLPGHGRSATRACAAGYGFDDCLADLVATLEACGHRRAHWLGYSMGARLALGCAVRHPGHVASLVLLAGRAGIADPHERAARRAADDALAARIEAHGVEAFVEEWLAQPLFAGLHRLGPDAVAAERRSRLGNDARGLAASLRALGPAAQPSLLEELPDVRVPVLLVAGGLDGRFVALAHDLARRLPRAEVCEVAAAGHAAHVEQPEVFVDLVRDFLRRASGPAQFGTRFSFEETAS